MKLQDTEMMITTLKKELETASAEQAIAIQNKIDDLRSEAYSEMTAWDIVTLARHQQRPKAMTLIDSLFTDCFEQRGDRFFSDDGALWGGIGRFLGLPVTILAQRKGRNLNENLASNFGMMNPEGYRKAIRLAKQAEKFRRPIITIVDTAGAYPGKGAEERGQAEAIAQCLKQFMTITVPIITIVLSEGGSGGALALSVSNHIMMLENAMYSILSPEGFASILWKDETLAPKAAELMELTSLDLYKKGIVDEIINEPLGGAQENFNFCLEQIRYNLMIQLKKYSAMNEKNLLKHRYEKFRKIGDCHE